MHQTWHPQSLDAPPGCCQPATGCCWGKPKAWLQGWVCHHATGGSSQVSACGAEAGASSCWTDSHIDEHQSTDITGLALHGEKSCPAAGHTWCCRWPGAARRLPQSPGGRLSDGTAARTLSEEQPSRCARLFAVGQPQGQHRARPIAYEYPHPDTLPSRPLPHLSSSGPQTSNPCAASTSCPPGTSGWASSRQRGESTASRRLHS